MSAAEFVDTNIFVYAYEADEREKYAAAKALIERLWVEVSGRISTQVLLELYTTISRKKPTLSPATAFDLIEELSAWPVHSPTAADVLTAIRLSVRHSLSIWDAMIVQAAIASGCSILWSEELQHGRRYENVIIRNPFLSA